MYIECFPLLYIFSGPGLNSNILPCQYGKHYLSLVKISRRSSLSSWLGDDHTDHSTLQSLQVDISYYARQMWSYLAGGLNIEVWWYNCNTVEPFPKIPPHLRQKYIVSGQVIFGDRFGCIEMWDILNIQSFKTGGLLCQWSLKTGSTV